MIALERIDAAIRAAAGYLTRHCDERGAFLYRTNLDAAVEVKPRYNLVRHAGSIYALVRYCELTGDRDAQEAVRRAIRYLCAAVAPIGGRKGCLAVVSDPAAEHRSGPAVCKLGASGLALAALGLARRLDPGLADEREIAGLSQFLLFMQKDSGEFYSKYEPLDDRRRDDWTSLYYPGEAALGLLSAYRCDGDPRWLAAARQGLEHLARKRQGRTVVEADHWALLATAELLTCVGDRARGDAALLGHSAQICESTLAEQRACGGDRLSCGWFTPDRRTTPTATRLEGLFAALGHVPDTVLRARIVGR